MRPDVLHRGPPRRSRSRGFPLVVEWARVTTCEEMLHASRTPAWAASPRRCWRGTGSPRETEQLAKEEKICKGAVPREHSHFFTEWGTFGSLDWNGDQVDDGVYEIVDDRTFTIGDTTYHFEVQGDELMLEPVLDGGDRFDRGWMVAVAFPGKTWKRVS
jgi:hypothetical protein